MIVVKIDLKKIDQSKCFNGKNGAKYLDVVLMENKGGEDQYGNTHMAVQGVSQEDRKNNIRGAILGNAKTILTKFDKPAPEPKRDRPESHPTEDDSQIPF